MTSYATNAPAPANQHLRGVLLTALGVLVLTPDCLLIRLVSADVWTLMFWRGLLQGLTLVAYYVLTHGRGALAPFRAIGRAGLCIAALYAVGNIFFIISVRLTSVANTLIILSSSPLIGALFTRIFLRETVHRRTWIAAVVGLLGIGIIFASGVAGGGMAGNLCALIAATLLAGTFVVIRRGHAVNMVPAVALSGFMIAALTLPIAAPAQVTAPDMLWLGLLGVVVMPISFGLITLGPRTLPAPEVSLLMLLETILGPAWVWLALGEKPPAATLLGGAIVLGALVIHSALALREVRTKAVVPA